QASSRPVYTETPSVARAIAISEATGASMYIVPLSSAAAVELAVAARRRELHISIEARPIYLFFTCERYTDSDGPLYVGNPPLREQSDVDRIWSGLAN